MATVDILVPTFNRPSALAIILTSLVAHTYKNFNIIISDQTEDDDVIDTEEVQAVIRVPRQHGHAVSAYKHLPRRGMAEQRQFLLDQVTAPYALFIFCTMRKNFGVWVVLASGKIYPRITVGRMG